MQGMIGKRVRFCKLMNLFAASQPSAAATIADFALPALQIACHSVGCPKAKEVPVQH